LCSEEELRDVVKTSSFYFIGLAGIAFISSVGQLTMFLLSSQRQALRMRRLYFRSLFRQEMAWYDKKDSGEILTHIAR